MILVQMKTLAFQGVEKDILDSNKAGNRNKRADGVKPHYSLFSGDIEHYWEEFYW
jgi:hypothetical protein